MLILAINPGATSIKAAIFQDEQELTRSVVRFDTDLLQSFSTYEEQSDYRLSMITEFLSREGYKSSDFDCVVSRGGPLKAVSSGAYSINEQMLKDAAEARTPQTQGIQVAYSMMHPLGKPCLIYDAVSADEWEPVAKITGLKGCRKKALQHTLNARRVAIETAEKLGKPFHETNLLVAHIGGGTDVVFFRKGQIIETIGYNDFGFSPERCGALPFDETLELMKTMSYEELRALNRGKGGLVSYFGTADIQKIEEMIDAGDQEAELVLRAMIYRIAQTIGAGAVSLQGAVDAVILTGGGAYSERICSWITEAVTFIAPVYRVPGEMEMKALAMGALRVMRGEEAAKEYQ